MKKHWWVMMAAAVLLVIAGCSSDGADAEVDASADATTTTEADVVKTDETEAPEPDADEQDVAPEFAADAPLLDGFFEPIEPGTWRHEDLGIPMSLDVADGWEVHPNERGLLALATSSSQGPGDNDVAFVRVHGLADPANYGEFTEDQEPWDAKDLDGWLDAMPEGLVAEGPERTTVGGRDATKFVVALDDRSLCGDNRFCVGFTGNEALGFYLSFEVGVEYVVYWVDMGEFDPLAIVVADAGTVSGQRERGEAVVSSIAFGEPGANPAPLVDAPWEVGFAGEAAAGVIELPVAGGIAFDTAEEFFAFNAGPGHAGIGPLSPAPAAIEFLTPMSGGGVDAIATVDDLVIAIGGLGIEAIPGGTVELRIGTATIVDVATDRVISGPPPEEPTVEDIGILTGEDQMFGWQPPQLGRLWVVESERGLVAISAESYEGDDGFFDEMVALAESLAPSLRFVDEPDGSVPVRFDDALINEMVEAGRLLPAGEYVSTNLSNNVHLQLDVDASVSDVIPELIGLGPLELVANEGIAIFTAVGVPGSAAATLPMPDDLEAYFSSRDDIVIGDTGMVTASGVEARWWDLNTAPGAGDSSGCRFGSCAPILINDTVGEIVVGDEWDMRVIEIPDPDGTVFVLAQSEPEGAAATKALALTFAEGIEVLPQVAEVEPGDPNDLAAREMGAPIEPGTYYAEDLLPMPIEISVVDGLALGLNLDSAIAFEPQGQGPADPFRGFAIVEPVNGLADPADIGGPDGPPESFVEVPDDLATWVDQIPQIELLDSGSTSIGGIESPWVEVAVVAAADRRGDCGQPCLVMWDWSFGPWILDEPTIQRIHTVAHPAGTVFVVLEAPADGLDEWAAEMQPMIESIAFG